MYNGTKIKKQKTTVLMYLEKRQTSMVIYPDAVAKASAFKSLKRGILGGIIKGTLKKGYKLVAASGYTVTRLDKCTTKEVVDELTKEAMSMGGKFSITIKCENFTIDIHDELESSFVFVLVNEFLNSGYKIAII